MRLLVLSLLAVATPALAGTPDLSGVTSSGPVLKGAARPAPVKPARLSAPAGSEFAGAIMRHSGPAFVFQGSLYQPDGMTLYRCEWDGQACAWKAEGSFPGQVAAIGNAGNEIVVATAQKLVYRGTPGNLRAIGQVEYAPSSITLVGDHLYWTTEGSPVYKTASVSPTELGPRVAVISEFSAGYFDVEQFGGALYVVSKNYLQRFEVAADGTPTDAQRSVSCTSCKAGVFQGGLGLYSIGSDRKVYRLLATMP